METSFKESFSQVKIMDMRILFWFYLFHFQIKEALKHKQEYLNSIKLWGISMTNNNNKIVVLRQWENIMNTKCLVIFWRSYDWIMLQKLPQDNWIHSLVLYPINRQKLKCMNLARYSAGPELRAHKWYCAPAVVSW